MVILQGKRVMFAEVLRDVENSCCHDTPARTRFARFKDGYLGGKNRLALAVKYPLFYNTYAVMETCDLAQPKSAVSRTPLTKSELAISTEPRQDNTDILRLLGFELASKRVLDTVMIVVYTASVTLGFGAATLLGISSNIAMVFGVVAGVGFALLLESIRNGVLNAHREDYEHALQARQDGNLNQDANK